MHMTGDRPNMYFLHADNYSCMVEGVRHPISNGPGLSDIP